MQSSSATSTHAYHPNGSQAGGVSPVSLGGVKVLIIASGHAVTDPRIAKQACSLRRLGADVTVVGRREHGTGPETGVLIVPKPSSRLTRFLLQPWRCLWAARWQHADIIHVHDAEMLSTLPLAKLWWRRSKFVYDAREDFANLMLIRDWLPRRVKPGVRLGFEVAERGLASLADGLVSVTQPLAEKFNNRRKVVAYNFASSDFFEHADRVKRPPQVREFDLVHLGTLNVRRATFLAETIRELHRLRPGSRSLVIGITSEIETLMRAKVPAACALMGRTPYEEIPRLLGNAKIGLDVHPWPDAHLTVALAVKVCEYMAAGCAVVASSMPVLRQVLAQAGAGSDLITVIEGGDPGDYARAVAGMVKAIEDGEDPGGRLSNLARTRIVWEEEAAKIGRLYLNLLGQPCAT